MDSAAQSLDYPYAEPPPAEEPREIAPGLFWIRMPLPFPPKHINLWLIADGQGWTIVDTGLHRDDTKVVWEAIFAKLARTRPVTRLICTHFHPDHMGAAVWLMRRWSIDLWMTFGEWTQARAVHALGSEADIAQRVDFYRAAGVGADAIGQFAQAENLYRRGVPEVPAGFRRISGGTKLRIGNHDWLPIIGQGHCPEHACLCSRDQGVLIGGDILLPRITPNIGVWPSEPLANPLALYLDCLGGFDNLPDDTLVLPSHGLPYRGLKTRLAQLRAHHAEELDALTAAMGAEGLRPVDCFKLLFKSEIGPHNIGLAVGEALAHMHLLEAQGRVRRHQDRDGVWRFKREA